VNKTAANATQIPKHFASRLFTYKAASLQLREHKQNLHIAY